MKSSRFDECTVDADLAKQAFCQAGAIMRDQCFHARRAPRTQATITATQVDFLRILETIIVDAAQHLPNAYEGAVARASLLRIRWPMVTVDT